MGDTTLAIRFRASSDRHSRWCKLIRMLKVKDGEELLRLTRTTMHEMNGCVMNGGRIVLHGDDGTNQEYILLPSHEEAREFFAGLRDGE